jgi:hypothetical protein
MKYRKIRRPVVSMYRKYIKCELPCQDSMKILLFATLSIILMYSAISMAKPGFYLLSLNTPQQIEMELGPPLARKDFDQSQTVFMYRGGMVKPLCIDYEMTFSKGLLSSWTWHLCR